MNQSIRRLPPPDGGSQKRPHFWKEDGEWWCIVHGILISWSSGKRGSVKDFGKKPTDAFRRLHQRLSLLI